MPHTPLTGLIPATLTPFDPAGELNLAAVEPHAELLAGDGVSAVFVGGTTGEFTALTFEERQSLLKKWAAVARGSLRVIAHVGANSLHEARALAAQAEELKVSGVAAVAPSYFKPRSVDALVAWCVELAVAAPGTPFYFYDIPSTTGVLLPMPEFLEQAADRIPTFAGVKFSNPDLMAFQRLVNARGGRFDVLFGIDEYLLAAVVLGGQGAVGSSYNFAAPLYHRMLGALKRGDLAAARADQFRSVELIGTLFRFGYLCRTSSARWN